MTTQGEYAYIAGLFDGEGTIHISNQLYLAVRLRNTNKAILKWIQSIYKMGHIYSDNRSPNKPCYSLELASYQALSFLKPLLPYLKIKQDQATLAFQFQQGTTSGRDLTPSQKRIRETIFIEMSRLNHR